MKPYITLGLLRSLQPVRFPDAFFFLGYQKTSNDWKMPEKKQENTKILQEKCEFESVSLCVCLSFSIFMHSKL